jgi:hypothetical protein
VANAQTCRVTTWHGGKTHSGEGLCT